jgi:hypothetical protein
VAMVHAEPRDPESDESGGPRRGRSGGCCAVQRQRRGDRGPRRVAGPPGG